MLLTGMDKRQNLGSRPFHLCGQQLLFYSSLPYYTVGLELFHLGEREVAETENQEVCSVEKADTGNPRETTPIVPMATRTTTREESVRGGVDDVLLGIGG